MKITSNDPQHIKFFKGNFLRNKKKNKTKWEKMRCLTKPKNDARICKHFMISFSHFLLQNNLLFFSTLKNLIKKNL